MRRTKQKTPKEPTKDGHKKKGPAVKADLPQFPPRMKRGRKPIGIDWEQFDKLCMMFCTLGEIASWFDVSVDTIERRCLSEKGLDFAAYYKQKSDNGLIAIRRAQLQTAIGGSVAMLIWLGKQKLGQRDQLDHRVSGHDGGPMLKLDYAKLSLAELDALEELRAKAQPEVLRLEPPADAIQTNNPAID